MARAFRYGRLLDEERSGSISEIARAERIERGYLGALLRLTLLAPKLIEDITDGRKSRAVHLPRLLVPFSAEWEGQGVGWG